MLACTLLNYVRGKLRNVATGKGFILRYVVLWDWTVLSNLLSLIMTQFNYAFVSLFLSFWDGLVVHILLKYITGK